MLQVPDQLHAVRRLGDNLLETLVSSIRHKVLKEIVPNLVTLNLSKEVLD
jgi:hypothetical protein